VFLRKRNTFLELVSFAAPMATFILIPGAWLGSWVWKKITPMLEQKGHVVYPITLTGMGERVHLASKDVGMETASQDVLNVIKYNDIDEVFLVGHSFAGKVAAVVADRAYEKVRKIIYLDAARPNKVRTPQLGFDPEVEFGHQPAGSFVIPFTQATVDQIGSDVKDHNLRWMLSKATPWPIKLSKDPITLSENFDRVRSAYIFCTKSGDPVDEIISGKWGILEGPYQVIDAGHWPMVTKPQETADAILSLAIA
jgi:pimeloyl-ACP methyl ester carboxylesterase